MNKVLHKSESQDWTTPECFLELVYRIAQIRHDPASQEDNPTDAVSWSYQDPDQNFRGFTTVRGRAHKWNDCGLRLNWPDDGLVFCNPPYGRQLSGEVDPNKILYRTKGDLKVPYARGVGWAKRMAAHYGTSLYLVPSRTETKWFRTLHGMADLRLDWSSDSLGARLKFGNGKSPAPFPSTVFFSGTLREQARFAKVFGCHGTLLPGGNNMWAL